ncbi:DNA primase [Magnetospira sp. QH-2]|uniref:DNA primase n=1 Tax=Magnetospira sp. (strain QH-2) TaxID=1288970 RepID=UPI0003E81951|nr:DNA primase [Magnetospira sp. QH-2]CCQ72453.1 DNA primase [Magnetospira sp. QH-2]
MAFTPQFLDELRARLRPVDVIGRTTRLIRKGNEHQGLCPFHKEKTPSFYVYDDHYHCFGCGVHGSVIDFVMNTENLSFPEAVEKLADEAGLEVPVDSPEERQKAERRTTLLDAMELACAHYEKQLRMPEGASGLAYFSQRGLDDGTIARFRLGFAPSRRGGLKTALARANVDEDLMVETGLSRRPDDGRAPYDYFRDRVLFPITDRRGKVIAFGGRTLGDGEPKYLNSPETPLFHKSRTLYGLAQALPAARKSGQLTVTEGYMDVIALHQAGIDTAVAPLGTALTEDQIQELWRIAPEPVLCFDGDAAGQKAAARAADRCLPLLQPGKSLRFALLPTGEDPDSLIRREGPGAMREVLETARPLSDALWTWVVEGARANTPERRAALWKELKDRVFRIQDPTVRKTFLESYESRFWAKPSHKAGHRSQGGHRSTRRTDVLHRPEGAAEAHVDSSRREDQLLLALFLCRPAMFETYDEEFGRLAFRDPGDERLRQALVDLLSDHRQRDSAEVVAELTEGGHGGALSRILTTDEVRVMRRAGGPLHPETQATEVEAIWSRYRNRQLKDGIRRELSAASDAMSDDDLAKRMEMIRVRLGVDDDADED